MKDIYFESNDKERLTIDAFGKSCEVTPCLSLTDLLFVKAKMNNSKDIVFDDIVSEIISNHTEGVFNKEEISSLDDTKHNYITLCVEHDSVLKGYFNEIVVDNVYEKFIRAIVKYAENFNQQHQSLYTASMSSMLTQITSTVKSIMPAMVSTLDASKIVSNTMDPILTSLKANLGSLAKAIKVLDYSSAFENISSSILKIVKEFQVPSIPEDKKRQLILSYEKWGKLGWTLPPNAAIDTFSTPPVDAKSANKIIGSYTTKTEMNELFCDLLDMKRIKKSDIKEAIECFNDKHYKACAMILFSMMDARLIRLQGSAKKNKSRDTGKKAVEKLFNKIDVQGMDERVFFIILNYYNIWSALKIVFKFGDNFKSQYKIINRNFLDHGMLHRKVSRRDCCMLFILLYNFTQYLNDYIDGDS